MPAILPKLKRKIKRTPASVRLKTKRDFKRWERSGAGRKMNRIQASPARMVKFIMKVRIPKYKAWIKSAKEELQKASGPEKAEIKRKLDNHKLRLRKAKAELVQMRARAKDHLKREEGTMK